MHFLLKWIGFVFCFLFLSTLYAEGSLSSLDFEYLIAMNYDVINTYSSCCDNYYYSQFDDSFTCFEELPGYGILNNILLLIPSFHARLGDGRSYNEGYASVEGFVTQFNLQTGNAFYIDLDFLRVGNGRLAANSILGFRNYSPDFAKIMGAYIGYDYRRLSGGDLNQLGLGAEFLGECWDIRVNGYIPFKNKKVLLDTTHFQYTGGYFAIRDRYESAMWGLDIELGKELLPFSNCFGLYIGVGPYFYGSSGCCGSVLGGMGRVTTSLCDRIFLEFYITYDNIFNTKVQGEISFNIPFSSACQWWKCLFMPLYRNRVIVTEELCCWETNF